MDFCFPVLANHPPALALDHLLVLYLLLAFYHLLAVKHALLYRLRLHVIQMVNLKGDRSN